MPVFLAKHRRVDELRGRGVDLFTARPDIAQVNRVALRITPDRFNVGFEIHRSGERVRNYQRRGCQIIEAHHRINAALEIAIATEDGACDEIAALNRSGNRFRDWSAIADTRGAPVTDQVKAKLFQVW